MPSSYGRETTSVSDVEHLGLGNKIIYLMHVMNQLANTHFQYRLERFLNDEVKIHS